jgi:hypothetical protein
VVTFLIVFPRLNSDQVTLKIPPQKLRLNGQSIEIFEINTGIRGRIGEWMELGGVTQKRKLSEEVIGNRTATHNAESRKVFFKVDYP